MENKLVIPELPETILLQLAGTLRDKSFFSAVYLNERNNNLENLLENPNKEYAEGLYNLKATLKLISPNDNRFKLFLISLSKTYSNPDYRAKKGSFLLLEDLQNRVLFLFSPGHKEFFEKVIQPFMGRLFYPKITKVLLTSNEMHKTSREP